MVPRCSTSGPAVCILLAFGFGFSWICFIAFGWKLFVGFAIFIVLLLSSFVTLLIVAFLVSCFALLVPTILTTATSVILKEARGWKGGRRKEEGGEGDERKSDGGRGRRVRQTYAGKAGKAGKVGEGSCETEGGRLFLKFRAGV